MKDTASSEAPAAESAGGLLGMLREMIRQVEPQAAVRFKSTGRVAAGAVGAARCGVRYPEYAHKNFLRGCETRASERWSKCVANGGKPDPTERPEWALDPDEELYRNLDR